jgi:hypothetical protein
MLSRDVMGFLGVALRVIELYFRRAFRAARRALQATVCHEQLALLSAWT